MEIRSTEIQDIIDLSQGDVRAFDRLYQRYHRPVHANILKLIKSPELAVEVLQDVFLSLWQNRHRIHGDQSLGGWLFVVSYNQSLNVLRKKLKESIEYVAEYPVGSHLEDIDQNAENEILELQLYLVEEAVNELPKRKKEVFELYRYEGRTKDDIADMLGLSPRSVTNYLKEANKKVKEHVSSHYQGYLGKLGIVILLLYF